MLDAIKNLFKERTPEQQAARNIANHRLNLLEAQEQRDYYAALVSYHQTALRRLGHTEEVLQRHNTVEDEFNAQCG